MLHEARLIEGLDFGRGVTTYEHICGHEHHEHLVCLKCGRILEFSDPALEKGKRDIARRYGFRLTGHALKMFGYCRACARKKRL